MDAITIIKDIAFVSCLKEKEGKKNRSWRVGEKQSTIRKGENKDRK